VYNAAQQAPCREILLKKRLILLLVLLLLAAHPIQAQEPDIVPGYWEESVLPQTGLATYYAPGLMEAVQGKRAVSGQIGDCPECVGAVALLRAGDIGRKVWLQPPGGEPVGPFLVVDCTRRQDVMPLLGRGWAVDVSYELGQIWGMTRPLEGVTVLEDPADAGNRAMARSNWLGVPTPFYVPPGQVVISAPTSTPTASPVPLEGPTPWPTRLPGPLPGRPILAPPPEAPGEAIVEPTPTRGPPLPTPLTPVVTTPTPEITPGVAMTEIAPAATVTPTLAVPPIENTPTPVSEVSLGRAGAGLLRMDGTALPTEEIPELASPVPLTPTRTPRPDLTPILPDTLPTPVATPPTTPGPLLQRLWRELLDSLR
jgi:hypothetical protein